MFIELLCTFLIFNSDSNFLNNARFRRIERKLSQKNLSLSCTQKTCSNWFSKHEKKMKWWKIKKLLIMKIWKNILQAFLNNFIFQIYFLSHDKWQQFFKESDLIWQYGLATRSATQYFWLKCQIRSNSLKFAIIMHQIYFYKNFDYYDDYDEANWTFL